jgi:hypothetical protein
MSTLSKAMKDLKFDKRLTEINLANGQLTKDELKKHLESLPDLAAKIEVVNLSDDRSRSEPH